MLGFLDGFKIYLNDETGTFIVEKEDSTITLYGNIVNWYECIAHGQACFDDDFVYDLFDYCVYYKIKDAWPDKETFEKFKTYAFLVLKPNRIYDFGIFRIKMVDGKKEFSLRSSIPYIATSKAYEDVISYFIRVEKNYDISVENKTKIGDGLLMFYDLLRKSLNDALEFVKTFIQNKILIFKEEAQ